MCHLPHIKQSVHVLDLNHSLFRLFDSFFPFFFILNWFFSLYSTFLNAFKHSTPFSVFYWENYIVNLSFFLSFFKWSHFQQYSWIGKYILYISPWAVNQHFICNRIKYIGIDIVTIGAVQPFYSIWCNSCEKNFTD